MASKVSLQIQKHDVHMIFNRNSLEMILQGDIEVKRITSVSESNANERTPT